MICLVRVSFLFLSFHSHPLDFSPLRHLFLLTQSVSLVYVSLHCDSKDCLFSSDSTIPIMIDHVFTPSFKINVILQDLLFSHALNSRPLVGITMNTSYNLVCFPNSLAQNAYMFINEFEEVYVVKKI